MDFDNRLFEDTPIEFKEINHTDFDSNLYKVEPKEIVEPNDEGYLSDNLTPILTKDLHEKNTTVINAGVGQGKTTAIIEVIKEFANSKDYIVVIAVPFKSLIEQYEEVCIKNDISKHRIFNQLEIDKYFDNKEKEVKSEWGSLYSEEEVINKFNIRNFDVHILTVNALLGNSVESLFQVREKTEYFNRLLGYCEKTDKKLVFVFDEIHASIHNFKEEFIYKLWNYHGLVHKNYIVSATYNEASKEVIKYLSEFTDNTIKIIESTRLPVKEKQSELYLNFYIDRNIEKDETLFELIKELLDSDKKFDILVYSKKLVQKLTSSKSRIGQLFISREADINKSINDPFSHDDGSIGYDKEKINIGTKFSTGISIEHEEHTYIVIFPKDLNVEFIDNKGIFTMGSNTIIQALARQRKKGEIYLFMPPPIDINEDTLPLSYTENQKNTILDVFKEGKKYGEKTIDYSYINGQGLELDKTYNKLYREVEPAIEKIETADRDTKLNRLQFPTKEIFNLDKGEKHLVRGFFGGDLPAYILWASLTNQFLNCRLKDINFIKKIYLNTPRQYEQLEKIVEDILYDMEVIEENYFYINLKPFEKIELFKNFIFSIIVILDKKKIGASEKVKVLLDILKIILFDSKDTTKTEVYQLYLKSCVMSSIKAKDLKKMPESKLHIVNAYKKWKYLVDVIELNIETYKKHNYIDKQAKKAFAAEYKSISFQNDIKYLLSNDILLSTGIFPLKNTYEKERLPSKKMNTIYNLTINVFFSEKKETIRINNVKTGVHLVKSKKVEKLPNLLFKDLPEEIL
ncbi:DEAD/DEAH box helicase family protein [Lacinutrix sp. C3R15]|uniref:DEAD/DEAH box helicase n=1 Tax=Flavobacteriaceae TaxID=49546 RepID=UPI001C097769|nr:MULTISPECIES: DEAD/DEAH box helicase [Flavobacteriaceae]MBU2939856.1 DEAD/DEAH box helicase family protein [Lacinutrix sp. C3R15]MDO6623172.1 DEAD/DEAH box helicase family protein [Oceanihabitans sp. 1_MG-2023]